MYYNLNSLIGNLKCYVWIRRADSIRYIRFNILFRFNHFRQRVKNVASSLTGVNPALWRSLFYRLAFIWNALAKYLSRDCIELFSAVKVSTVETPSIAKASKPGLRFVNCNLIYCQNLCEWSSRKQYLLYFFFYLPHNAYTRTIDTNSLVVLFIDFFNVFWFF